MTRDGELFCAGRQNPIRSAKLSFQPELIAMLSNVEEMGIRCAPARRVFRYGGAGDEGREFNFTEVTKF